MVPMDRSYGGPSGKISGKNKTNLVLYFNLFFNQCIRIAEMKKWWLFAHWYLNLELEMHDKIFPKAKYVDEGTASVEIHRNVSVIL